MPAGRLLPAAGRGEADILRKIIQPFAIKLYTLAVNFAAIATLTSWPKIARHPAQKHQYSRVNAIRAAPRQLAQRTVNNLRVTLQIKQAAIFARHSAATGSKPALKFMCRYGGLYPE